MPVQMYVPEFKSASQQHLNQQLGRCACFRRDHGPPDGLERGQRRGTGGENQTEAFKMLKEDLATCYKNEGVNHYERCQGQAKA